jgi:hypothetical protein
VRTIKLFAVIGLAVALVGVWAAQAQYQCPGASCLTLDVTTPPQQTLSVRFTFDNNVKLLTPLAQLPYQNIDRDGTTTPCLFNETTPVPGGTNFKVTFSSTAAGLKFKGATFFDSPRCTGKEVGGGSVHPVSTPTLTEWGLIALAVLLAGSLAFMIRRRLAPRPAGA